MELLKQWNIEGSDILELQEGVWCIDQTYILKAYEHQSDGMKNLHIYQSLQQYGIPIPEVIPTRLGESYAIEDNTLYILTLRLFGNHKSKEEVISNPAIAHNIGKTIAKLHRAFAGITGQINLIDNNFVNELKGWIRRSIQEHAADSFTHEIIDASIEELAAVYDRLDKHLIHRDLHLGNLLFDDNEVTGYIDFDLSQINARIFDIAYLCAGWTVEQVTDARFMADWKKAVQDILSGYQEEQPLSFLEMNALGIMMCCIEILFVAYFSNINDTANSTKAEECLRWLWKNRMNIIDKVR